MMTLSRMAVYSNSTMSVAHPPALTQETLARGVSFLITTDRRLARIHAEFGPPPLWARTPGFPTLVHIILEQQVSIASAKAAFLKLQQAISRVRPEAFLDLDDGELKRIGFSRQKAEYCRGLARAVTSGELDLKRVRLMDDDSARAELMRLRGIGRWTADIYLLMCLLRPDVWPSGDMALAVSYQRVSGLRSRPHTEALAKHAERWRPWRAVAARFLWHDYLSRLGGSP